MTKFGCCLVLLASLCCGTAQAAEFLLLDIDASPETATIMMTDSSSIVTGDANNKLATLLSIHEAGEWDERKMQLDCTAQRWRELSGIQHNMNGGVHAERPDDNWADLGDGTRGLRVHDIICAWPDKKPGDDRIVTGDLQDIINRTSMLLSNMVTKNQRERDGDN